MKNTILSIVLLAVLSVSCNQKNTEKQAEKTVAIIANSEVYACSMHPEVIGALGGECLECGMKLMEKVEQTTTTENKAIPVSVENVESSTMSAVGNVSQTVFATDAIVSKYLKIKNALTKDDSNGATAAARNLLITLNGSSTTSLNTKSKNKYDGFVADAKAHVKHISDNAGKMEHQREYFSLLSTDIYGLIKAFGTKQTLYQDYCPMYGDGKTGYWISETKEVINPYFGSEMLNCGRRITTIKQQ